MNFREIVLQFQRKVVILHAFYKNRHIKNNKNDIMAALGKIRKRGVALVIIIGLGLFAFIAEEAFRSCEATKNQQRQQIG